MTALAPRLSLGALLAFLPLGCSLGGLSTHPGTTTAGSAHTSSTSGPGTSTSGIASTSAGTSASTTATSTTGGGATTASGATSSATASTGTTGASSSSTTGGSLGTTTGSVGSIGTTGTPGPRWTTQRVLATDGPDVQVWDLTEPLTAGPILQSADLGGSIPVSVTMAQNDDILVLTQNLLQIFDAGGGHAGAFGIPDVPPLEGVTYVFVDGGAGIVVVSGGGIEAFSFAGSGSLDGGVIDPTPLWGERGNYRQCAPGPGGTILAAYNFTGLNSPNDGGVAWFDAATGYPHGSGTFALSLGGVSGVALGSEGEVFFVGDDGDGNGFAALFSPAGECLMARSGGACGLTCGGCITDANLADLPLNQAAALGGDGGFLATIRNQGIAQFSSNKILEFNESNGLATTVYYQGGDVSTGGPQFLGISSWPAAPTAPVSLPPPCTSATCLDPSFCGVHGVECCSGSGAGAGNASCVTDCDCGSLSCFFERCE